MRFSQRDDTQLQMRQSRAGGVERLSQKEAEISRYLIVA
jgi:hypothetical protein